MLIQLGSALKKIFFNFTHLSILQISSYLFPLITFPYLVRVLGVENYGLANFALAFAAYFVTLTDYGFDLSATREISISKANKEDVNQIFCSTVYAKIFLSAISTIIFLSIVFVFNTFHENLWLYIIAFLSIWGNVLFPGWYFQGIEKMMPIAVITIVIRSISVVLIFLLVRLQTEVFVYLLIYSGSSIFIGLVALLYSLLRYKIVVSIPQWSSVFVRLKNGWHIFLANISINLYSTSNTFLLGLLGGYTAVGYFSAANKIREAAQGFLSNFGRSAYPSISTMLARSKKEGLSFVFKYARIASLVAFIFSLAIYINAELIINVVAGSGFEKSISVLKIMAFVPFIIMISNIFGVQLMLNFNFEKEFKRILSWGALINILLMLIFVPLLNENGAALSIFFVEIFITVSMGIFLRKKKIV